MTPLKNKNYTSNELLQIPRFEVGKYLYYMAAISFPLCLPWCLALRNGLCPWYNFLERSENVQLFKIHSV
jgi:hypothetical protein